VFLGWLDPIEIETNGRYELRDSETSNDVYIIKKNFQFLDDEYFLIENRQPKLFDEYLWEGGILIWHIDDKKSWMRERGYPGQEGTSLTLHRGEMMKSLECCNLPRTLLSIQVGHLTTSTTSWHYYRLMEGMMSRSVEIAVTQLTFGAREWRSALV
jgi:hypothetical protein